MKKNKREIEIRNVKPVKMLNQETGVYNKFLVMTEYNKKRPIEKVFSVRNPKKITQVYFAIMENIEDGEYYTGKEDVTYEMKIPKDNNSKRFQTIRICFNSKFISTTGVSMLMQLYFQMQLPHLDITKLNYAILSVDTKTGETEILDNGKVTEERTKTVH